MGRGSATGEARRRGEAPYGGCRSIREGHFWPAAHSSLCPVRRGRRPGNSDFFAGRLPRGYWYSRSRGRGASQRGASPPRRRRVGVCCRALRSVLWPARRSSPSCCGAAARLARVVPAVPRPLRALLRARRGERVHRCLDTARVPRRRLRSLSRRGHGRGGQPACRARARLRRHGRARHARSRPGDPALDRGRAAAGRLVPRRAGGDRGEAARSSRSCLPTRRSTASCWRPCTCGTPSRRPMLRKAGSRRFKKAPSTPSARSSALAVVALLRRRRLLRSGGRAVARRGVRC